MTICYTTVGERQGYHTVQLAGCGAGRYSQHSIPKWYLPELCNGVPLLRALSLGMELTVQSGELLWVPGGKWYVLGLQWEILSGMALDTQLYTDFPASIRGTFDAT